VLWGGGLAGLIGNTPQVSGALASMGAPGPGRWVSWYANPGHVYMQVAGIYMNTENGKYLHSPPQPPTTGPRWSTANSLDSPNRAGFTVRHPPGL
jgi:hypothetical protein